MLNRLSSVFETFRKKNMPATKTDIEWRHAELMMMLNSLQRKTSVGSNHGFGDRTPVNRIYKSDHRAYRTPPELEKAVAQPSKVLIVGSCLSEALFEELRLSVRKCEFDFFLVNNYAELPAEPPAKDFDFHVVQVALSSIVPDGAHVRLAYDDVEGHRALFEESRHRLAQFLRALLRWNEEFGVLTFVTNFLPPQQDLLGRMLPKNDLRNFVYFTRKLNEALSEELAQYDNVYVLDVDEISANFGRKYFQDDSLWIATHGAQLSDHDFPLDAGRLQPVFRITDQLFLEIREFYQAWWAELVAMYNTAKQQDSVKLAIFDLDDTLWRGVAAEFDAGTVHDVGGWPLGLAETVAVLKKRGVMLAIVSKNDEERIRELWDEIMPAWLPLSTFAAIRINWRPKADNIAEILKFVNVLPRSVVFVDDNPVERAAVTSAFPDIRTLGANLYSIRRNLLWSAQAQVASISAESARRTESIQAQAAREADREALSHEDFMARLEAKATLFGVSGAVDPSYPRSFELLNKTNQFNTTGKRWTQPEMQEFLGQGGQIFAFEVEDKYTKYGLVGVMLVASGNRIQQFVMSCRVMGMGIETSMLAEVGEALAKKGAEAIEGIVVETDANRPSRDLFEKFGMKPLGRGRFRIGTKDLPKPAMHLKIAVR